ncbi:MAG: DinB family protein [Gordonia paraffinivorans]
MTETTTTVDDGRTDLLSELAVARETLIGTTEGLTDEQLGERPTASSLCLGGLLKHVASTEAAWARFVTDGTSAMATDLPEGVTWQDIFAGTARTWPQWAIDRQNDFAMLDGDTRESIVEHYRDVASRTEEIIAGVTDLSRTTPLPEAPWNEPGAAHSVRRVLVHLVAETSQHAGHAEIIRESIDGRTTM